MRRRDFLTLASQGILTACGLIGLGGVLRFLSFQQGQAMPDKLDLGPAADYPQGSRTVLSQAGAILLHTPAGFQALSLTCPHLGCQVQQTAEGFACPCHNSRFDAEGRLIHGPADRPLQTLRVEQSPDGHLILYLKG